MGNLMLIGNMAESVGLDRSRLFALGPAKDG